MNARCVPMMHVPDVRATVDWYESIGFRILETHGDPPSFAIVGFGDGQVMFSEGGVTSTAHRREVDLYVYIDNVDAVHARLKDRVDVVEGPHDTFYGMREVIIRDLNRFWITFGEVSAGAQLLEGVAREDAEAVVAALGRPGVTPDLLSVALTKAAEAEPRSDAIVAALEGAHAAPLRSVDRQRLRSYEGCYAREDGATVRVILRQGILRVCTDDAFGAHLVPLDDATFRPLEFDTTTVTFEMADGRVTAMIFTHGAHQQRHTRMEDGKVLMAARQGWQ